jgi:hypothetical protein
MIQGHRRLVDGPTETPDGFPLPITGSPLTKTPVVVKQDGVELKQYPETFIPGEEDLGADEIRLTCIGSGNPFVRRAQAATGWLCELGNGDKFIFDVGGGTVQNLWSLEIHPALLDKLFLTHLHLDHVGDFHPLYDALGWARNSPLHVWGPSGYTPEMGTAYFCEMMDKAALWHDQSKMGIVPSEGMEIVAHSIAYMVRLVIAWSGTAFHSASMVTVRPAQSRLNKPKALMFSCTRFFRIRSPSLRKPIFHYPSQRMLLANIPLAIALVSSWRSSNLAWALAITTL